MTRVAVVCACAVALALATRAAAAPESPLRPELTAVFSATSYDAGGLARLRVVGPYRRLELQILRAGAERKWSSVGRPWGPAKALRFRRTGRNTVLVRLGGWSSGLYFARLTAPGGRAVAFAPFVVRPGAASTNRVAIVLPTYTWQAYNTYDANGDGRPDNWYRDPRRHSVVLGRPFVGVGKPPHYRTQQRGFLRFLVHSGKPADYLTDEDLERTEGPEELAQRYDLIVFSGHEEYVTEHIYDVIEGYRNLGGNLAFLSANNFFWRVNLDGRRIWRTRQWRTLGRPEAALIGVQYRGNDRGGHAAPYVLTNVDGAPWLFAGLGLADGQPLGAVRYGIEFDMVAPESPPGTTVLATIPDLFGPGRSAEMAYYEHASGARVFSAGVLNFGGQALLWPETARLLENVWRRLGGT